MNPNDQPCPQCPECGRVLHPKHSIVVVSDDDDEPDDYIPDGMPADAFHKDIFAGLYCSGDCILDAITRGWPEYRSMAD